MKKDMNQIADKYTDMLYRIAYVNLKNSDDAEDVVQEAFFRYFTNTKKIKNEEHERRWLIKVILNLCKNLSESAWKRHTVPLDSIDIILQTKEQEEMLEELNLLKEKYRTVIQLFYYQDLSVENISKILNITETNVRSILYRARKKLKYEIEKRRNLKNY